MCVFQIGVFNSFFKSILIATSWYACFKLFIRRNATYETSNYER